jgi:hypothetical protein
MEAQNVFMPAGKEIETTGNNILSYHTGFASKGEYPTPLREQERDMFTLKLAKVHSLQWV